MANTASTTPGAPTDGHAGDGTRRDFLYIATAMVGAVGAAAALVPLIDHMNPDASTLAAGGPVELDVGKIEEGGQVMVRWRERPIFVFRRSKKTLDSMQSSQMMSSRGRIGSSGLRGFRAIRPEAGLP